MNQDELLFWASKHNLQDQSKAYFWSYTKNYIDEIEDSTTRILKLIDNKYLTLENWAVSYSVIFIDDPNNIRHNLSYILKLNYCEKYIGFFKVFFTDEGEIFDEELAIEDGLWIKNIHKTRN